MLGCRGDLGGGVMRVWLVVLFGLFSFVPAAAAADLEIAAFHGRWQGTAISETDRSITFAVTARDLDVSIQPSGTGFRLAWTTIRRQKGDPNNPQLEKVEQSLTFVPAGQKVWRAEGSADPLSAPFGWAGIRGQTLTVNVLTLGAGGSYEVQSFERKLTGGGMELEFDRIVDGEKVRTARGRLVKVANN